MARNQTTKLKVSGTLSDLKVLNADQDRFEAVVRVYSRQSERMEVARINDVRVLRGIGLMPPEFRLPVAGIPVDCIIEHDPLHRVPVVSAVFRDRTRHVGAVDGPRLDQPERLLPMMARREAEILLEICLGVRDEGGTLLAAGAEGNRLHDVALNLDPLMRIHEKGLQQAVAAYRAAQMRERGAPFTDTEKKFLAASDRGLSSSKALETAISMAETFYRCAASKAPATLIPLGPDGRTTSLPEIFRKLERDMEATRITMRNAHQSEILFQKSGVGNVLDALRTGAETVLIAGDVANAAAATISAQTDADMDVRFEAIMADLLLAQKAQLDRKRSSTPHAPSRKEAEHIGRALTKAHNAFTVMAANLAQRIEDNPKAAVPMRQHVDMKIILECQANVLRALRWTGAPPPDIRAQAAEDPRIQEILEHHLERALKDQVQRGAIPNSVMTFNESGIGVMTFTNGDRLVMMRDGAIKVTDKDGHQMYRKHLVMRTETIGFSERSKKLDLGEAHPVFDQPANEQTPARRFG